MNRLINFAIKGYLQESPIGRFHVNKHILGPGIKYAFRSVTILALCLPLMIRHARHHGGELRTVGRHHHQLG